MIANLYGRVPGIGSTYETFSNEFRWGSSYLHSYQGANIDVSARDAGSTPTTTLRAGLLLGTIASTGKLREYAAANADGSDVVTGILAEDMNVLGPGGAAAELFCSMIVSGPVKPANLYGFDENARSQMDGRFLFDDRGYRSLAAGFRTVAKPAGYTAVAADNGTTFTTTGAAGAVTFVLPNPAKGLRFRFFNTVNQNMVIQAPAGKLIGLHGAAFTTLTFSTASEKIGAAVEVVADDTGTFWLALLLSANTPTFA